MGVSFQTKAGVDIENICPDCQCEGVLGRIRFVNKQENAAFWCPECEKFFSDYIPRAALDRANIVLARLTLFKDNTVDTTDATERIWSARPDCFCGSPMRLGRDKESGVWKPRWVCPQCGMMGEIVDPNDITESFIRLDRLPDVRVVWAHAIDYATDYLTSSWWKRVRWAKLWSSGEICAVCRSTEDLNVHHNTYRRLGCERPEDLIVLCRRCHETFHDLIPKADLEEDNDAF